MKLPFVSRERYDEKCAELESLRKQLVALQSPRPTRTTKPQRDPMLEKMTAQFESSMGSEAGRAEAERLRRQARDELGL